MSQALKRQRSEIDDWLQSESLLRKLVSSSVGNDEELNRKVKDVVRYALACEYKKMIIRKEDINKKILHEHSRQFNTVFKKAKEQLVEIFGMDLLEIPVRDKIGKNRATQSQQPNSSEVQAPQAKPQSTNSFILYNCLNKELEAHQILHETDEEYASMGLLYFILSIIFVNEQELGEVQLKSYLDKVGVKDQSSDFGDLDKLLTLYVKQGYLHRFKDEEEYTYQWGSRSKAEISYKALAKFVSSVYGTEADTNLEETILKSAGIDTYIV
ncbi:MAGE family-domain-containing protein [Chlamydoabsidia padenii]|nr:MAGE family-domain-containing protein [Chlamydoabsidia padenii]